MSKIVLSYRRADSAAISGRIFDRLHDHYGEGVVFMDIDAIAYGYDFRNVINDALSSTDILLAIVGPRWLGEGEGGGGGRRIDEEADFVRIEVESALVRGIPVIPVLVEQAAMPSASNLPESLHSFAYRHHAMIDSGIDFHSHVDRLIRSMDQVLAARGHAPGSAPNAADESAHPVSAHAAHTKVAKPQGARDSAASVERADPALGGYMRDEYAFYEGDYLFIRPASVQRKQIYVYPFQIGWEDEHPGLVMRQVAASGFTQFGSISIPRSSMHIFVNSNDSGWLKLAVFSQLDQTRRMRGMLLTVGQTTGGVYLPTVMPAVMRKLDSAGAMEARAVSADDDEYTELRQELAEVVSGKYARILRAGT
jgi:hypothetical protein